MVSGGQTLVGVSREPRGPPERVGHSNAPPAGRSDRPAAIDSHSIVTLIAFELPNENT